MLNLDTKITEEDDNMLNKIIYQNQSARFEPLRTLDFIGIINNLKSTEDTTPFLEKILENKKAQNEVMKLKLKSIL